MTKPKRIWSGCCALALSLMLAAMLWAGPINPDKAPPLSGEELSLAGLRRVRLSVPTVHRRLVAAGVKPVDLFKQFRAQLKDAQYDIVEDESVPELVVRADVLSSSDKPDVVVLIYFMEVHQGVKLLRLNQEMTVPTTTLYHGTLCAPDKLAATAREQIASIVTILCDGVEEATRAH